MLIAEYRSHYQTLKQWQQAGHKAAVATVVATWRSSPRISGSQLIVNEAMQVQGSVSGGCVESDVIQQAQQCMQSQEAAIVHFGVSDENAWSVGLTCGGEVTVLIEPVTEQTLQSYEGILQAQKNRQSVQVLRSLKQPSWLIEQPLSPLKQTHSPNLSTLAATEHGEGIVALPEADSYLQTLHPPYRLWIFGAVHTAVHLATQSHSLGFEVTVIDPRPVFANSHRFPQVDIATQWPQDFLKNQTIDDKTAIVALNHDPKFDDVALAAAIASPAAYIGALVSSKTQKKRLQRLLDQGFSHEQVKRIYGPIGLSLGNNSAAHIALSISAQLLQVLYPPLTQGS